MLKNILKQQLKLITKIPVAKLSVGVEYSFACSAATNLPSWVTQLDLSTIYFHIICKALLVTSFIFLWWDRHTKFYLL